MLATGVRVAMVIASTTVHVDVPHAARHSTEPEWGARASSPLDDAVVYDGRAGQTVVRVPRIDAHVEVDGTLTAAPWRQAAVLTGFSEYTPIDGQPAEDSTEVLVWYSPTAMYFGVRAYEPHGSVHATLADRDKIDADDNIQLILSPFLHSRQALVFAVNPLGVQEDGTITEGTASQTGFGVTSQTGPPPTDLSPDFVYESKGHITTYGYEVVIRIPFRSVKYQSADPQDWGLNIVRKVQHSGHSDTWAPTALAAASFLGQSGTLEGLTGLERGLVLDVNPFVTQKAIGDSAVTPTRGWRYGVERPQFGANVRWGITNNLTLNGTYRPDFAEVESDATQLVFDPRLAIYYPEKRPFFLDGLEQFNTPNNLIYTRQIDAPLGATKLTGKLGGVAIAYLGAQDEEPSIAGAGPHPLFNVVRLLDDVGSASQIGAVVTDKEDGGSFNRVGGLDARFTFAKVYSLALQGAGSSTRVAGQTTTGPLWEGHFIRAGRTFGLDYDFLGISPDFVAGSGFLSRTGVAYATADHRYTIYGSSQSFLETFSVDVLYNATWMYQRLTAGQSPEDRKSHFSGTATFSGGWQLLSGIYFESYGYDPSLYANYFLGHIAGSDTTFTPFVGQTAIPNTDYVFQLNSPQFSQFSGSILYLSGRDENFFEWATADIGITELTVNWRPTSKLRWAFTYDAQFYHRHSDGSLVGRTNIPRLDVEYQLSRPIFFRLVGQYDAAYQDNLRDDSRTNLPIFFFDPATGTYTRASRVSTNQFQVSGLFSYQPVPGTVAFVGYGNNLIEPAAFHFTTLRRVSDSFFVKISYLIRS